MKEKRTIEQAARLARAASHHPQKSATRRPYKRGPKTTLGLGSRIRGGIGVGIGIGIGNCIGIGNGYRVRYLGQSVWREKGRQCEEMSRSKATDDAATSLSGHPEKKSNYPFFLLY